MCVILRSGIEAGHLSETGLKDILSSCLEESRTSKNNESQNEEKEYKSVEGENDIDIWTVYL